MKGIIYVLLAFVSTLSLTLLLENSSEASNLSSTSAGKSFQLSPGIVVNKLQTESKEFAVPGFNITPGIVIKGLGESIFRMPYTVTVTFDSLTVNDDHDHSIILPGRSGDGEFDLAALYRVRR